MTTLTLTAVLTLLAQGSSDATDPSRLSEFGNRRIQAIYTAPFRPPGERSWALAMEEQTAVLKEGAFGSPRGWWLESVAVCNRGIGNYDESLQAWQSALTCPADLSRCGNAQAQHRLRVLVHQGVCLEGLGRHDEAVEKYFLALGELTLAWRDEKAFQRIVDLYESAGATGILLRRLDLRDWDTMEALPHQTDARIRYRLQESLNVSAVLRGIVDCRRAAAAGQWDELLDALRDRDGASKQDRRGGRWVAFDMTRLLGSRPQEVLPLVRKELRDASPSFRNRLASVLSECATPEAAAILRDQIVACADSEERSSLVLELSHAGAPGRSALKALEESGSDEIQMDIAALRRRWAGDIGDLRELHPPVVIEYPPIPKNLRLK